MNITFDIAKLLLTTRLSDRKIAASIGTSKTTIRRYRKIAIDRQLGWEQLAPLTAAELDNIFNAARRKHVRTKRTPDVAYIHAELQRLGVTLQLLWEEYRALDPDSALGYTQFTFYYREFRKSLKLSMRQTHKPGECIWSDFSGKKPSYVNPQTGEVVYVELFVSAIGSSTKIFAYAVPTQKTPDWIGANIRMLEFYGGVPTLIVPDNLKAAVIKPGRDPILNRTYLEFARHYDVVIAPARPIKPRDKPLAEVSVLIAQRWILARLRNETFFSLAELNAAIFHLLEELNDRVRPSAPVSRNERFAKDDLPVLRPLPAAQFDIGRWQSARIVPPDYHLTVDNHWYSVPYILVGKKVEARSTSSTVEFFHNGDRIAIHARGQPGGRTTLPEHQPDNHRAYSQRSPDYYIEWAKKIGPNLEAVVAHQFDGKSVIVGLKACDSLRSLVKSFDDPEIESAACRAIEIKSPSVKSMRSLLQSRKHAAKRKKSIVSRPLPMHENIRGESYFCSTESEQNLDAEVNHGE